MVIVCEEKGLNNLVNKKISKTDSERQKQDWNKSINSKIFKRSNTCREEVKKDCVSARK